MMVLNTQKVNMLLLLSHFSRVRLCVTPSTAAHQAPLSLGFSRQEHWSGVSFPSPTHACMVSHFSRVQLFATRGLQPTGLLCPQDSPGKNTGVGCHFLLRGIFPTQESNLNLPHLLHCRQILYPLSHLGGTAICPKHE